MKAVEKNPGTHCRKNLFVAGPSVVCKNRRPIYQITHLSETAVTYLLNRLNALKE